MAKISLRAYNREIEGLIEQSQRLDEASAHCRHILKTFPKHLETYRLLGKANLEAKRYDQAVDIFQRVLVAAPDDFVSHVGMSIIADDKGKLDDAIWHMERAFEVQPSNAAIQGELQRLFGRRDGVEPPKIRLTRGALAHMYVQGELYTQAISEIRAVLANDPKRTDMQTLLARAYFRNGQKAEATEICTQLLSKYPYCLDANRLMVEIVPGTQRADTVQEYRQRVVELDPYAAFAQDSIFRSESVADNLVMIDHLEYNAETVETPPALGIGLDSDATMVGRAPERAAAAPAPTGSMNASDVPAWLSASASASPAPAAPGAANKEDIPDFLRKAGWESASGPETPPSASPFDQQPETGPVPGGAVEGDLPAWVRALAPSDTTEGAPAQPMDTAGAMAADTPDWLRNLGSAEPAQPAQPAATETPAPTAGLAPSATPDWMKELGPAPAANAPAGETPEAAPDWLKDLGGRELDEPAAPAKNAEPSDWLGALRDEQAVAAAPEPPADESPDWLKDFGNDLETPIAKTAPFEPAAPKAVSAEPAGNLGALGTTAQEQDDAMAWLESLAAKHGAKPEELVTDPNARTDVAPEWVDKAKEIGDQPTEPVKPQAVDETGVWLRNLEDEQPKAGVPQPAEEAPFDFRAGLTEESSFTGMGSEPAKEEPPILGEAETPDWLKDFGTMPAERGNIGDAPDWLRGMADETPAPKKPLPGTKPLAQEPAEPAQSPAAAEEAAPAEMAPAGESTDLPSWLAGLDEEAAKSSPAMAANQPADGLPAWLQAEPEPEPEAKEPANPSDWRPAPPEPFEVKLPAAEPKFRPSTEEVPPTPAPEPVRTERASTPTPVPARQRPVSVPPKQGTLSLGDAQSQLGRGNIAAALDIYSKLIRKGKSLEDIIRDLRDALYRYPVEVPLWQSLGDAYMRANRLQEALDAYTKAEELLR